MGHSGALRGALRWALGGLQARPRARDGTRRLVARADAARDAGQYAAAALLYDDALRLEPRRADIQIQAGHMHKEAGNLDLAEGCYLEAARLTPDDPDLALQIGHFYKVARRWSLAETAYARALTLKPGWAEPSGELTALRRRAAAQVDHLRDARAAGHAGPIDLLVPELMPRPAEALRRTYVDGIHVARLGARMERSRWGLMRTLRGVEAVRGHCVSSTPLREVQVMLDGKVIHAAALHGEALHGEALCGEILDGAALGLAAPGGAAGPQCKYVFNLWLDLSRVAPGLHEAGLCFTGPGPGTRTYREQVVVAAPLTEAAYPASDMVVDPPAAGRPLVEAINARPSMVRPAARAVFPTPPRNVLVLRTDQLGDMVTSIPAMRRLRALLPDARIVGLLTAGNAEFAATLGLFDEAITVDFPDDPVERRRIMPLAEQEALRARLQPYAFDIALDLAESSISRPLLLLSGAKFLYGFYDRDWPWLDAGFDGAVHDPANRLEAAPQSTKVLALVERLGSLLASGAEVIRRPDLERAVLGAFGLVDGVPYAVLHTGARIAFSRWPGYPALAQLLLARTGLHVVLMTDDPALRGTLPPGLLDHPRFRLLDGRLPFDAFDALLSFCAAFVGNDSGPKHLAALRGAPVVSIHSSRINWNEWGQELRGSIISRRVPCAGCVLYHDPDECGQDFACIRHIRPEEVYEAVTALLPAEGSHG